MASQRDNLHFLFWVKGLKQHIEAALPQLLRRPDGPSASGWLQREPRCRWWCPGDLSDENQQHKVKKELKKQMVGDLSYCSSCLTNLHVLAFIAFAFLTSQWKTLYKARVRRFNLQKFYRLYRGQKTKPVKEGCRELCYCIFTTG